MPTTPTASGKTAKGGTVASNQRRAPLAAMTRGNQQPRKHGRAEAHGAASPHSNVAARDAGRPTRNRGRSRLRSRSGRRTNAPVTSPDALGSMPLPILSRTSSRSRGGRRPEGSQGEPRVGFILIRLPEHRHPGVLAIMRLMTRSGHSTI